MLAKEALFVLGVSRPVLQRLVKNGKIRVVEMESGNKFVYDYNPDDVMTVREEREKAGKSKRFAWRREAVYAVEKLSCEDNDVIGYGSILKVIKNGGRSVPKVFVDYKDFGNIEKTIDAHDFIGASAAFRDLLRYVYQRRISNLYIVNKDFCLDFNEIQEDFLKYGVKVIRLEDLRPAYE